MNLLVTAPMRSIDLKQLKENFADVIYKPWTSIGRGYNSCELLDLLLKSNADALISELDDVSEEVLDVYHQLIFIGDCRANPANIDLNAATKYRIPVLCTPARNAEAVAELLVGSLICLIRNVPAAVNWAQSGQWIEGTTPYHLFMGHEIYGKKIGFVGLGAVGKAAARILSSFGAEILFYDPYVNEAENYKKQEKIESIFLDCDIVSIHLPVLPSTIGMINKNLINLMKPSSIFINTSRSAVVDTSALVASLKEKRIAGAVIDVYDHEPAQGGDLELIRMDNVLATPHICGASYEVIDHQSQIMLRQIKKWLAKEDLSTIVFNNAVL